MPLTSALALILALQTETTKLTEEPGVRFSKEFTRERFDDKSKSWKQYVVHGRVGVNSLGNIDVTWTGIDNQEKKVTVTRHYDLKALMEAEVENKGAIFEYTYQLSNHKDSAKPLQTLFLGANSSVGAGQWYIRRLTPYRSMSLSLADGWAASLTNSPDRGIRSGEQARFTLQSPYPPAIQTYLIETYISDTGTSEDPPEVLMREVDKLSGGRPLGATLAPGPDLREMSEKERLQHLREQVEQCSKLGWISQETAKVLNRGLNPKPGEGPNYSEFRDVISRNEKSQTKTREGIVLLRTLVAYLEKL